MANLLLLTTLLTIINLRLISAATESPPPASVPTLSPLPPPLSPPTTPPPPISSTSIPPPPPPSSPPSTTIMPPPSPPTSQAQVQQQQQQLNNIIDALIGAGDFAGWANILSNTNPSTLPLTATLFIPGNNALSHLPSTAATGAIQFDPFIIPYHIVPQRLSFSDLQLFKTQTRLPTLLPTKTILITNNSPSNFTIDNSPISHPDMYVNSAVSVHGIGAILDYTIYGGNFFQPPAGPTQTQQSPPEAAAHHAGEVMGSRRSDAGCLCIEYPLVFLVICTAFAFKIHKYPLKH